MAWERKRPEFGDQIRVNRGFYYHHGIYVDDNNVIQFGSINGELDSSKARVIVTTLQDFLKNATYLEVRTFQEEELSKKRSPSDVVNYAFMQLGRGGYNIISNNCEHFANECLFGTKESEQVNEIFEKAKQFYRR